MSVGIPMISAMPQFAAKPGDGTNGPPQIPADIAASSPILQALLQQTGGASGLGNVNSLVAANPQFGQALSFMSPGGGLNPAQAQQFGPLFALMMSLQGGGK